MKKRIAKIKLNFIALRKKDIYVDINTCGEGCQLKNFDLDTSTVDCECSFSGKSLEEDEEVDVSINIMINFYNSLIVGAILYL